ncbi:uncharacterized protein LDX57_003285 [Aspergillus melleus]|uniref:uncharacterized protein n=1 Tax=Aspergillus melleus TaxID=138277 RepID=UPI001E8EB219|nr:uncharacterized protein LDX57_003285 [Aspergillus melleus]KAH8425534.1 hypothetical protein LDX57_003285 [Aspergillus melleus]
MPGYEPGEVMDIDELYYRGDENDESALSEDDQKKVHIQGVLRQIETRLGDSTMREALKGIMKHYQDAFDKVKEFLADPENEERRYDGWSRDWNLRESDEAVFVAFGAMADPYIHVLKSDPKNKEAKAKVRDLDVRLQTWFNSNQQMGSWDELIGFYNQLASIMPDSQADHELHLQLEDFLETNHYPLSWAMRAPFARRSRKASSEPGTDAVIGEAPPTGAADTIAVTAGPGTKAGAAGYKVPTTRAGEIICGYKHIIRHFGDKAKRENEFGRQLMDEEWDAFASHAYVFAILSDSGALIGELRSLKDGSLVKIDKPLLTRIEYRKLRNGKDADHDIVEFFEENGQEPLNEVRGSSGNTRTDFERPMVRMPKQISNIREATEPLSQSEVVNVLYVHEKQMKEMKGQMEKMEKAVNWAKKFQTA